LYLLTLTVVLAQAPGEPTAQPADRPAAEAEGPAGAAEGGEGDAAEGEGAGDEAGADPAAPAEGQPAGAQDGGGSSPFGMLPAFILIGILFWVMLMRPQRKEQAQRKQMLAELKKNDHVLTIGGIYGVVVNVRPEADEVTLKVDEATSAKLRVTLASIARVVRDEAMEEKTSK
jgi:preprotein translocase subunit YajC